MSAAIPDTIRRAFGSWTEYVNFCESTENSSVSSLPMDQRSSRDQQAKFRGTANFDKALSLAREGWQDKAAELERISLPLIDRILARIERYDPRHDIEGQFIDVARFVQNEPECWVTMTPETVDNFAETKSKLVRIVFDGGVSVSTSTKVIFSRGAALAALINVLECSGYSVELTKYVRLMNSARKNWIETVISKQFDQPLNMAQIVFALCHPSALRRLTLSVAETEKSIVRNSFGFKLGKSYSCPSPILADDKNSYDIVISGQNHFNGSDENISAWVETELKKQGIEIKQEKLVA